MLPPWENMLHEMRCEQLRDLQGMQILDYGSGSGVLAAYLSRWNDVTAVEPDPSMVTIRGTFAQHIGGPDVLKTLPDASFDAIVCHNVLEYVPDRAAVLDEFDRLLRHGGRVSVIKHNRAGRVMQSAVLLDDPAAAHALLDGGNSHAARFGEIRYYPDEELTRRWRLERLYGLRTFWDLQQDQKKHPDADWQREMLRLEHRVSTIPEYQAIAFFHHLRLIKEN